MKSTLNKSREKQKNFKDRIYKRANCPLDKKNLHLSKIWKILMFLKFSKRNNMLKKSSHNKRKKRKLKCKKYKAQNPLNNLKSKSNKAKFKKSLFRNHRSNNKRRLKN